MDHCAFCLHRPEPLLCRWEGDLRLEAADGPRRLLGVFSPQGESLLHFVELGGETRTWPDGDGLTRAVTVYNRASLPMDWVGVEPARRSSRAASGSRDSWRKRRSSPVWPPAARPC